MEHDEDTMRAADYLIDIGPGAGIEGGQSWRRVRPKQVTFEAIVDWTISSWKKYIPIPATETSRKWKFC